MICVIKLNKRLLAYLKLLCKKVTALLHVNNARKNYKKQKKKNVPISTAQKLLSFLNITIEVKDLISLKFVLNAENSPLINALFVEKKIESELSNGKRSPKMANLILFVLITKEKLSRKSVIIVIRRVILTSSKHIMIRIIDFYATTAMN